jgi:plastocyanin
MQCKLFSLAFAGLIGVATLGASFPANAQAQSANKVVMKNFDFSPMMLTVSAGSAVTWKNLDGEPHTVTSVDGLFRSGALDTDESFTFKFMKPGIYKYLCSIHPRMMAEIIVK